MISRERAIAIAKTAHSMKYYEAGVIEVAFTNGQYIVIFPVDTPRTPTGTPYPGADYAAKVWIDSKTGSVLKVMVGS